MAGPRRREGGGPLVLGHRGAMARAPENSLASFQRAVQDGADGVELDVRLSADDQVLVFHDPDLHRLAGDSRRVGRLTWAEIAGIPLRSGARVPRLQDVLQVLPQGFVLNVEIKADTPGAATLRLVDRTAEVLARGAGHLQVIVSSFDPGATAAWAARGPDAVAALLFEDRAEAAGDVPPGVSAVHPHHQLCSARRVSDWHAAGLAVNTWTVDDVPAARALAAMGVDGVVTNDPAALVAGLAARDDQNES